MECPSTHATNLAETCAPDDDLHEFGDLSGYASVKSEGCDNLNFTNSEDARSDFYPAYSRVSPYDDGINHAFFPIYESTFVQDTGEHSYKTVQVCMKSRKAASSS